jgi:hypothetical protein
VDIRILQVMNDRFGTMIKINVPVHKVCKKCKKVSIKGKEYPFTIAYPGDASDYGLYLYLPHVENAETGDKIETIA